MSEAGCVERDEKQSPDLSTANSSTDHTTMRLWSLHPSLLDPKGLTAAWREALLAQAVLAGRTKGYRKHPQLVRFVGQVDPRAAIAAFLTAIWEEASSRGYNYDRTLIEHPQPMVGMISVTRGQVLLELEHLRSKLWKRHPESYRKLPPKSTGIEAEDPPIHPLFYVVDGPVEEWERNETEAAKKKKTTGKRKRKAVDAAADVDTDAKATTEISTSTRVLRPRKTVK